MLKIALCDDCPEDLAGLRAILEAYRRARPLLELAVCPYAGASGVLDAGIDFDIFLLDILMPGLNGIELGRELRLRHPMAPILYLTTSRDYALESYRTEAMGYLMKPADREALFRSLDRAVERCVREAARAITVHVPDGVRRVFFYELVYAEAVRRTLLLHLLDGRVLPVSGRSLSFVRLWETLREDGRFLLVRRGCLVNLDAVEWMGERDMELSGGGRLSFPRDRRAELRRRYLDYCHTRFSPGGSAP